jgi:exopolyphosphatase/guanosine-5'-triphosphate,3'-diphosphate pyrophosphatase
MQEPEAAIDLGTNTARLLIGKKSGRGGVIRLALEQRITRLGGGFTRQAGISPEAATRAASALNEFAGDIRSFGVKRVHAVATSAVRDAVNGKQFCDDIVKKTGITLQVIDGRREALLTLRGVLSGIDDAPRHLLVFDVGGGSTEYTIADGATPLLSMSLPLGVVRLTEGKKTCEAMTDKIIRELAKLGSRMERDGLSHLLDTATLIGTAGTVTTLAAISLRMSVYDYRRVNNYSLTLDEIRSILATLLPLTPAERLRIPGMGKGREDLIIAGMLIIVNTMEMFGFDHLKVSDFGLLEGILLEAFDEK